MADDNISNRYDNCNEISEVMMVKWHIFDLLWNLIDHSCSHMAFGEVVL